MCSLDFNILTCEKSRKRSFRHSQTCNANTDNHETSLQLSAYVMHKASTSFTNYETAGIFRSAAASNPFLHQLTLVPNHTSNTANFFWGGDFIEEVSVFYRERKTDSSSGVCVHYYVHM